MSVLTPVRKRLLAAYEAEVKRTRNDRKEERMTMARLLRASGLEMDRSTLHRKLHGDKPMTADEAAAIGAALRVRVTVAAVAA